jgi:hypothetical protein
MADRNEVFRLILEGRDKLSGTLGSVRKNVEGLDRALTNLKKGHEDFPLFGGGKAVRSSSGRFVNPQDLTGIDRLTFKIRGFRNELNATIRTAKKNEDVFNLFGGGSAARGAGGRFEKVAPRSDRKLRESFGAGFNIARDTETFINSQIAATKEIFAARKRAIAEEADEERIKLTALQQSKRTELLNNLRIEAEADEERIDDLREERREADSEAEKNAIRAEIRLIRFQKKERERLAQEEFTAEFQRQRAAIRFVANEKRRLLSKPDIDAIQEEAQALRAASLEADTAFARFGKRAGAALGDIGRGFRSARSGMTTMERDTNLLRNTFTRLGFAVGNVLKNFNQFVNLRWTFLTGILSTFLTIITQVGAALIAVGASALQAAAALGGAFLAAVSQAAPAVGLLAAAFSRFGAVLDAVKLGEKLDTKAVDNLDKIRDAGQRLSDSQWSLKKALEGVKDANFNLKESQEDLTGAHNAQRKAVKDLADAKIQAARDIVDANFDERESALALKEAELGVLQAKQKLREEEAKKAKGKADINDAQAAIKEANERLKIAKEQGDQSEISSAQQQLTLAEQNLNVIKDEAKEAELDLKDAKLEVQQANLQVEQARVRNTRAIEDAAKARKAGVDNSDIVKNAREQLKDAIEGVADAQRQLVLSNRGVKEALHQVAVAHREVAEAQNEKADATRNVSQASQDAAKAFADLSPAEKKLFTSLKRIRKTFHDVFAGTSERDGILGPITLAISRFIDVLEKMLRDPKIQKAARRLATVLGQSIDRLAQFVGGSKFKELLVFFTEQASKNIPKIVTGMLNLLQTFLTIAKAATPIFNRLLDRFIEATGSFKRLTSQKGEARRPEEGIGAGVATINESGLDRFLGMASKNLDAWLKLAVAIGKVISALTIDAGGAGQTLVERLTGSITDLANYINNNPKSVKKFFDDTAESVTNLFKILGRLGRALATAFTSDEFLALAEVMSEILIPGLVSFLYTLGKLSQALLFLLDIPIIGDLIKWVAIILVVEKSFNKILPVTQKLTNIIKVLMVAAIKRLVLAFGLLRFALISTGIGALIVGTVLLIQHWDKVKAAATKLWKWIVDAFERVTNWVKKNWKRIILTALLAPFIGVAAVITALYKFRDRILGVFKTIGAGITGAFTSAFRFIREQFSAVIDWIKKQYDKLPGPVKAIIRGAAQVASGAAKVAGKAADIVGKVPLFKAGGGAIPGKGNTDTVPAMLTPGEWVVNRQQQQRLATAFGMAVPQVRAFLFGTNMGNKRPKSSNNKGGKKVDYYRDFNLVQQTDDDDNVVWFIELANGSFGQVTSRDAKKIQSSGGEYIPGYVKRSAAGFKQNTQRIITGGISGFSLGGVVTPAAIQRFASGGVVQRAGFGNTGRGGNTVNQNFNVQTQGETDWGYVMRLGAINAQESF